MQPSGCQPNIIAVVAAVQPLSSQLRPTHETHRGSLTLSLLPARNEEGSLWASAVWGQPGFLDASDPARLIVEPLDCVPGDPCQLTPGTLLGSTAIDLQVCSGAAVPCGCLLLRCAVQDCKHLAVNPLSPLVFPHFGQIPHMAVSGPVLNLAGG